MNIYDIKAFLTEVQLKTKKAATREFAYFYNLTFPYFKGIDENFVMWEADDACNETYYSYIPLDRIDDAEKYIDEVIEIDKAKKAKEKETQVQKAAENRIWNINGAISM